MLKKQKRHTHATENLIDQSPEKEMATPLPGLYRRSLPFPPAIEFNSSEGALGLGAAATALSSSLYTVDGGQCAVIFNPDLLSTHFSLHSLSLDEPRFVVFGFRSELLTCFVFVCVRDFHCNMSDCGVWIHCCLIVEWFESDVWNSEILFFFHSP